MAPRVFHRFCIGDRPSATCPPWWNVWRRLRIKPAWLRTTGGNGAKNAKKNWEDDGRFLIFFSVEVNLVLIIYYSL